MLNINFLNASNSQIWMGSLEPYMNEVFISNAFRALGEIPLRVKIMKDKASGDTAGYCFIHFDSEETARTVLHKLNGKVIPHSSPPVRFKLNYAGINNKMANSPDDFSLFIGDLNMDVDDYMLYKCLNGRYPSLKTSKVVLDVNGISKGYAFVRFGTEHDQKKCVQEMNGYTGLGGKPWKIGTAIPRDQKKKLAEAAASTTTTTTAPAPTTSSTVSGYDYSQNYYDQAAWQGYSWTNNYYFQQQAMAYSAFYGYGGQSYEGMDDMALIEHTTPLNVEELNQAVLNRDCDFWDSIESSKWALVDTHG